MELKKEECLNNIINVLFKGDVIDTNLISDGYHTFSELYDHRINLFIALCKMMMDRDGYEEEYGTKETSIWKSKLHNDGSEMEGWFIMGIGDIPGKMITYHLPNSKWGDCKRINTLDKAPEWDGHTSDDVLKRLLRLDNDY